MRVRRATYISSNFVNNQTRILHIADKQAICWAHSHWLTAAGAVF